MNKGCAISKNCYPSVEFAAAMQCRRTSGNFLFTPLAGHIWFGVQHGAHATEGDAQIAALEWKVGSGSCRTHSTQSRRSSTVAFLSLLHPPACSRTRWPLLAQETGQKHPRPWYCLVYFCAVSPRQDRTSINGGRRH